MNLFEQTFIKHRQFALKNKLNEAMSSAEAVEIFKKFGIQDADTLSSDELKTKYKELSMKHHPDVGGKTEDMQDINNAYEVLQKRETRSGTIISKYAPYGWIITKEFDFNDDDDHTDSMEYELLKLCFKSKNQNIPFKYRHKKIPSTFTPKKIIGPRKIHPKIKELLSNVNPKDLKASGIASYYISNIHLFRLWDDDNIPLCEGYFINLDDTILKQLNLNSNLFNNNEGDPLEDYGYGAYGAVMMTIGEDDEPYIS